MRNSFETDAFALRIYFLKLPKRPDRFPLLQSMQEMGKCRNSRADSSNMTLLQFSSALTHKEELEAVKDE